MPRKGKYAADLDYDDYDDGYDDSYNADDGFGQDSNSSSYSHNEIDQSSKVSRAATNSIGSASHETPLPPKEQQISKQVGEKASSQSTRWWKCPVCTFDNPEGLQSCDICGALRHSPVPEVAPASSFPAAKFCAYAGASVLAKSLFAPLRSQKLKQSRVSQQLKNKSSEAISSLSGSPKELPVSNSEAMSVKIVPFKFDTPSPDDLVVAGKQRAIKSSSDKVFNSEDKSLSVITEDVKMHSKAKPTAKKQVIQQHNKLKNNQNGTVLPVAQRNKATLTEGLKDLDLNVDSKDKGQRIRGKGLLFDTYEPEHWMLDGADKKSKQLLHVAIVGNVDSGKSTLMGRILHILGRVSQKEMHKYEKEAKQKGKGSFSYAWVLDESEEERARGVTMTVAVAHFETPKFRVVVLDSPGHKDFVPNMISGASQADAAILLVDASIGAFEAGMEGEGKSGGQTREHTQLIRSFGVDQIIVAVNKMDAVEYSQDRFSAIKASLRPFLRQCGFKDSGIKWVPLSVMENQNLVSPPSEFHLKTWCPTPNLLEAIDAFDAPVRNISKPFRMPIAETLKSHTLGQAAVSGKVEGGAIKIGSKVLVMPAGLLATVKGIEEDGKPCMSARAGDNTDVGLQGVDPAFLVQGGVLCHPDYRVPPASRFELKLLILENSSPLLCGSQVVLYCHHVKEPAKIAELVSLIDQKSGKVLKRKPRCLLPNQSAIIEVVPERGVCVEEYSNYRALGRVSLRDRGKTLAVGIVTKIIDYE